MKMEDQERGSRRGGNQGAGRGGNNQGGRQNTSNNRGGSDFNPAENLDEEARRKGGQRSAEMQQRDERGHFIGKRNQDGGSSSGSGSRGGGR